MRSLDQSAQTVFADLNQRSIDAAFDGDFPENGNFTLLTIAGKDYWYYNGYDPLRGKKARKYVGPKADPAVTDRVNAFGRIKDNYRSRLEAVRMLRAAGFSQPDALSGALLDSIAKAGFFRLRGVLIGTIAFQTYPGLVGAHPDRHLQTGDIDLAQDHGISVAVDDQVEPLVESIQAVDPSFRSLPNLNGPPETALVNSTGYKVEFLVPNRGSDDNTGHPTKVPALGNIGAEPLRYLDFLIRNPVRSVVLHGAGVSVLVPAPERYAVHKLIVSTQRRNQEKIAKDLGQAEFLIEALARYRFIDLIDAWAEAWQRGAKWSGLLAKGLQGISAQGRATLQDAAARAAPTLKLMPERLGMGAKA